MTTLLEKFRLLTDSVTHEPRGIFREAFVADDYRTWPAYTMVGKVDLNAIVDTFIEHLEEIGSPWDGRTVSIDGQEYSLSLGIRIAPVNPIYTLVHIYPTTELKGTL